MAISTGNRSSNFGQRIAVKPAKQLQTTSADLYGGANDPSFGANNEFLLDELEIEDTPEFVDDESINGTQISTTQDIAAVPVKVSGKSKLWSLGLEEIMYSALGWVGLGGPGTGGTHLFLMDVSGKDQRGYTSAEQALVSSGYNAADRLNRYLHVGKYMGPGLVRASNVAIKEFTISGSQKEAMTIDFSGSAERVERDSTSPGLSTLTKQTSAFLEWFALRNASVKLGVAGSQETQQILSLSIKGTFGQAEGQYPTGTQNNGLAQAEPLADGMSEVTVEFERYRHDTDDYKTWEQAGTEICMSVDMTRGTRRSIYCMPRLRIQSVTPDLANGGKIKVTCKALIPTGTDPFTTERSISGTEQVLPFATPLYVVHKNGESVNYARQV